MTSIPSYLRADKSCLWNPMAIVAYETLSVSKVR